MKKCLFVFFVLYVLYDNYGSCEEENYYQIGRIKYIAAAVYAEEGLTLRERVKRILEYQKTDLTDGETGVNIISEYDPAVGKDENESKDSK